MSGPARIPMLVNGVTHLIRAEYIDKMACGLVVFNRTLDSIMKMYIEGTGRDVDCMTCLVTEAQGSNEPGNPRDHQKLSGCVVCEAGWQDTRR